MDNKIAERIIKAVINWNGSPMIWNSKFLELQDHFDLIVEQVDEFTISLKTKMKD